MKLAAGNPTLQPTELVSRTASGVDLLALDRAHEELGALDAILPIITIEREFGARGDARGRLLAEQYVTLPARRER